MARDPKTGRFVKKNDEPKKEQEGYYLSESDEFFDSLQDPPQSEDYDFMKAIIIGIVAAAIGGCIFAFIIC